MKKIITNFILLYMSAVCVYALSALFSQAQAEEVLKNDAPILEKDIELDLDFNRNLYVDYLHFSESNYYPVINPYYNEEDNKKVGQDLVNNLAMFIDRHDSKKKFRLKLKFDHKLNFRKIRFIWKITW